MTLRRRVRRWRLGWRALLMRDAVPGYPQRGVWLRLRLDCAALGATLRRPGCWRAGLIGVAAALAAQVLVWEFDLRGLARDALQCLPAVLLMPWIAAARRRELRRLCAARAECEGDHGNFPDEAAQSAVRERRSGSGGFFRSGRS